MIISVSGYARSGKDTMADVLIKEKGFIKMSFAKALKDICKEVFELTEEHVNGDLKDIPFPEAVRPTEAQALLLLNKIKEDFVIDEPFSEQTFLSVAKECTFVSPRDLLQRVGTDLARNILGNNVWVSILLNKIKKSQDTDIVITDARFPDERDSLKSLGGITVYIDRPNVTLKNAQNFESLHISEKLMLDYAYDTKIINDGSLFSFKCNILNWLKIKRGTR